MIQFNAYGHGNILANHRNTLEITKDNHLTKQGDCIVGVNADFDSKELVDFIKNNDKFKLVLTVGRLKEEVIAETNKNFNDEHELVIRRGDFPSKRTFGIRTNKASCDFSREFVEAIKKDVKIHVQIEGI
jgi:uncharacterized protein